jgi:sulfonate transport system permease protein
MNTASARSAETSPSSPADGGPGSVITRAPGRAELEPVRHARRLRTRLFVLAVLGPMLFLSLWQLATAIGWLDPRRISSPFDVLTSDSLRDSAVWSALQTTTWRMLKGFVLGAVAGLVIGIAMALSRHLRALLDSLLTALYTIPKIAILPVFLTLFGFGEAPKVYLIAVTVFFFVWINTMTAIMSVPIGYREVAVTFRATRWQEFRHVLWPAALPNIFVGLRVAAGVAVLMVVSVELVLANDGLGNLIERGRSLGVPEYTFVGIVLASWLGVLFTFLIRFVGRKLAPWAPDDGSVT